MKKIIILITIMLVAVAANQAHAMTYGFGCFTDSNAVNCSGTDTVFSLMVAESDPGEVTFTISHSNAFLPADTGEITEVYFDGATSQLGTFISTDPTWNTVMVSPPELPSQNTATPAFETDFALDSDFTGTIPEAPIGPGESLDIVFNLLGTFVDLITAIDNGDLRLGLHVRSIELDGIDSSESFVTNVPVPATAWLLGSGLLAMVGFRRKRGYRHKT